VFLFLLNRQRNYLFLRPFPRSVLRWAACCYPDSKCRMIPMLVSAWSARFSCACPSIDLCKKKNIFEFFFFLTFLNGRLKPLWFKSCEMLVVVLFNYISRWTKWITQKSKTNGQLKCRVVISSLLSHSLRDSLIHLTAD